MAQKTYDKPLKFKPSRKILQKGKTITQDRKTWVVTHGHIWPTYPPKARSRLGITFTVGSDPTARDCPTQNIIDARAGTLDFKIAKQSLPSRPYPMMYICAPFLGCGLLGGDEGQNNRHRHFGQFFFASITLSDLHH